MAPTATPRPVRFATFWNLLKERGRFSFMGLVFLLGPWLLLLPLLLVMHSMRPPYESYDYATISRQGTPATARVTDISLVRNVNINGQSPRLITYAYTAAGQPRTDRFETFDVAQASALQVGDPLGIRVLNGQSVVPTMSPFKFPMGFVFLIPGIFTLIGLPLLLVGLLPALKKYQLYRHGLPRQGHVLGITARPTPTALFSNAPYMVSYGYAGQTASQLIGSSLTNDLLLVQNMKLGDAVPLFVSPTNETASCLVPRLEALKNGWQV